MLRFAKALIRSKQGLSAFWLSWFSFSCWLTYGRTDETDELRTWIEVVVYNLTKKTTTKENHSSPGHSLSSFNNRLLGGYMPSLCSTFCAVRRVILSYALSCLILNREECKFIKILVAMLTMRQRSKESRKGGAGVEKKNWRDGLLFIELEQTPHRHSHLLYSDY